MTETTGVPRVCFECGALIPPIAMEQHVKWHAWACPNAEQRKGLWKRARESGWMDGITQAFLEETHCTDPDEMPTAVRRALGV